MLAIKEYLLSTKWSTDYLKRTRIPPSFFLLGFQKCGTTSIYRYISEQPGFAPGKQKEVDTMTDGSYSLGKFLSYFPTKDKGSFTGNASHMMSYVPGGIVHLKEDFPNARLLAVMRDPIERAFSHYSYDKASAEDPNRRTMQVASSFDKMVEMELEVLKAVDDFHDIEQIYELTSGLNGYGMPVSRGLYYYYLKDFVDQGLDVMTFSIEELEMDFDQQFSKILAHIGVDKKNQIIPTPRRFNEGKKKLVMSKNTRTLLSEFYRPHNEKLYQFLGRNLGWQ